MREKIFFCVNLKRFDVPRSLGGLCPEEDPAAWIRTVIHDSIECGLDRREGLEVVYFVPEALLSSALEARKAAGAAAGLQVGCQGIYRLDVEKGGNFGAMTAQRPAASVTALGCGHALIAHSEERREKQSIMAFYDGAIESDEEKKLQAIEAVDRISGKEAERALRRGMKIVYCIGETEEQKGSEVFEEYAPRVRRVLQQQIAVGLGGMKELVGPENVTLGYEPVWAIGPGKKTPDGDYIRFVSDYIHSVCRQLLGKELPVIYGGGVKAENAAEISGVESVSGGLVALTKFTQPVGFSVEELDRIIRKFMA